MMVRITRLVGCMACLLACSVVAAQEPTVSSSRYYRMTTGGYSAARYRTVGHGGGCSDCGGGPVMYEGGYAGAECGGCGRCGHCCPGILPAIAHGVGAVADFVGGTLDCLFCAPRQRCCARPRACGRSCGSCGMEVGCGGGGCGCGADGGGYEMMPSDMPMEESAPVPAPTPSEARTYRPRVPAAQYGMRTAPMNVRKRPMTAQASAMEEIKRAPAAPRELVVPAGEAARLTPIREVSESRPAKQAASRSTSTNSLPVNPLRQ